MTDETTPTTAAPAAEAVAAPAAATTGAPAARYQHGAVWTGSKMIVWGGFGAASYESTGGIPVLRKAPGLSSILKDIPIQPFKEGKRQKGVYAGRGCSGFARRTAN